MTLGKILKNNSMCDLMIETIDENVLFKATFLIKGWIRPVTKWILFFPIQLRKQTDFK